MNLICEMKNGAITNTQIEKQFIDFAERLKLTKSKKQYGYLHWW